MRFNDWKTELVRAKQVVERLEEGSNRRYLIKRGEDPTYWADIFVRVSIWVLSDGTHNVSLYLECLNHSSDQHMILSTLSANELGLVAKVKMEIDRWLKGESESLPNEMPWEASLRG